MAPNTTLLFQMYRSPSRTIVRRDPGWVSGRVGRAIRVSPATVTRYSTRDTA